MRQLLHGFRSRLSVVALVVLLFAAACAAPGNSVEPGLAPPTLEPPTATAEPPTAEPSTLVPPTAVPPTAEPPPVTIPYGIVTGASSVNVRGGPGMAYTELGVVARGAQLEVIGRSLDRAWWQVRLLDLPNGVGWIGAGFLETYNVTAVPVVPAPPPPTSPPTRVPPAPPTPVPPPPPASDPVTLDWTADANYGTRDIYPTYDRQTVDIPMRGGGEVDAGLAGLPSGCYGFVTSAPDVEINYTGGSDLYLYFLSDSDATLIVNDPYGNWYCDDDSAGGFDPMVVFRNAEGGTYDVWVGRWGGSGLTESGTLVIGEFAP